MAEHTHWLTGWSRSQRGMGLVSHLFLPSQKVVLQFPKTKQLRFHFSTWYEEEDITIEHILCTCGKQTYPITIQGKNSCVLPAQGDYVSDTITLPEEVTTCTLSYSLLANHDITSAIQLLPYDHIQAEHDLIYVFSGVDVITDAYQGVIDVIGDSITEQGMWTTPLQTWCKSQGYLLINDGISGNRLCRRIQEVVVDEAHTYIFEGTTSESSEQLLGSHVQIPLGKQCFGKSGYERYEKEIANCRAGIRIQIFALGTNDIYQPGTFCAPMSELVDTESFLAKYRALFQCAKEKGWITIALSIPPLGKADAMNKQKLALRREINEALAHEPLLDAFINVDTVLCDDEDALQEDCHMGDHLHPNEQGGALMASCIIKEVAPWLG